MIQLIKLKVIAVKSFMNKCFISLTVAFVHFHIFNKKKIQILKAERKK